MLAFGAALLVAVGYGLGPGYDHWEAFTTRRIAKRWLQAGRLDRAAEAIQQALAIDSHRPEPWRMASELALRQGRSRGAVAFARRAAELSGYLTDDVLVWAETAVLGSNLDAADQALAHLDPVLARTSPRALRVVGDLALRRGRYSVARDRFAAALALDTAARAAEVPSDEARLGRALLRAATPAERAEGIARLTRSGADRGVWGRSALRALLDDAVARHDAVATVKAAEALRAHPLCTLEDARRCLFAVSPVDDAAFQRQFASVKAAMAASQMRSADLMGWLGQMGRSREAVAWARTLKASEIQADPLFIAVAEAYRQAALWRELKEWTDAAPWGIDVRIMQRAYAWAACDGLGAPADAQNEWTALVLRARSNPPEALLVAKMLYTWRQIDRSVALLWLLAADDGVGEDALETLARHYRVSRDAAGQYRAFARLRARRPSDRSVAGNYALFGALAGIGDLAEYARIAADNCRAEPRDESFRCAYAVVLAVQGEAARALDLLAPISAGWRKSAALAYAYGAALARAGRLREAGEVLRSLDPRTLTIQQVRLVQAAVR